MAQDCNSVYFRGGGGRGSKTSGLAFFSFSFWPGIFVLSELPFFYLYHHSLPSLQLAEPIKGYLTKCIGRVERLYKGISVGASVSFSLSIFFKTWNMGVKKVGRFILRFESLLWHLSLLWLTSLTCIFLVCKLRSYCGCCDDNGLLEEAGYWGSSLDCVFLGPHPLFYASCVPWWKLLCSWHWYSMKPKKFLLLER